MFKKVFMMLLILSAFFISACDGDSGGNGSALDTSAVGESGTAIGNVDTDGDGINDGTIIDVDGDGTGDGIDTDGDGVIDAGWSDDYSVMTDEEMLSGDGENLAITFSGSDSITSVTADITLPTTGTNGSTITWLSDNSSVITAEGAVTRSFGSNITVTLTATLTLNGITLTKSITLTVIAYDNPAAPALTTRDTDVDVSWSAVTGADSYAVYYSTADDYSGATLFADNITNTSVTITGLTNRTTYYVWLKVTGSTTSAVSPSASALCFIRIASVAAGSSRTAAVTTEGNLYTWGSNTNGELGNGTQIQSTTPIKITAFDGNVASVAIGDNHMVAVTTEGNLYAWGSSYYGQLGNGNSGDDSISLTPEKVTAFDGNVKAAGCCYSSCAVITTDGNLYAWGYNEYGLGEGTTTSSTTPVQITVFNGNAESLACGKYHILVKTTGANLYAWGYNSSGQLGDGTYTTRTTPVKITTFDGNVSSVASGYCSDSSMVITTGGELYAWGVNLEGVLGVGGAIKRESPVQISGFDGTILYVSTAMYNSAAVSSNGSFYGWGSNGCGAIGNGSTTSSSTPVLNENSLIAGKAAFVASGHNYTMIVTADGRLYGCGYNGSGELGNGTTSDQQTTPVEIIVGGE